MTEPLTQEEIALARQILDDVDVQPWRGYKNTDEIDLVSPNRLLATIESLTKELDACRDVYAAGVEARRQLDTWRRECVTGACESSQQFADQTKELAEVRAAWRDEIDRGISLKSQLAEVRAERDALATQLAQQIVSGEPNS